MICNLILNLGLSRFWLIFIPERDNKFRMSWMCILKNWFNYFTQNKLKNEKSKEELTDNSQEPCFYDGVLYSSVNRLSRDFLWQLPLVHEAWKYNHFINVIILLMLSKLKDHRNKMMLRTMPSRRQFMLIFLFFLCILFLLIYHNPRNLQPNETTTDNEGKSDLEWGQTSNFSWNSNSNFQLNQTEKQF